MIIGTRADIVEELKWGQPCYSCKRLFCYLASAKSHVTIGFQHGSQLADPAKLLEGTGKDMRHVKIVPGEDINKEAISTLVDEALQYDVATN